MKYLMSLLIILTAQLSLAGPPGSKPVVGRANFEVIERNVRESKFTKDLEELRKKEFKNMEASPEVLRAATLSLEVMIKGVPEMNNFNTKAAMIRIINLAPKEAMAEIAYWATLAKEPTATKAQRERAILSLKLIEAVSLNLSALALPKNLAAEKQKAADVIEITDKVSSLDYGQASKDFVTKFEASLREGKSVEDAVKIASSNKFDLDALRKCE